MWSARGRKPRPGSSCYGAGVISDARASDYSGYLHALEISPLKLEYRGGIISTMAGGTRAHAELSASVIMALGRVLPASCRVATSDLKVRIDPTDLSTFPDVSVVCGEARMSPVDAHDLINPVLLVEVTSKSTEDDDRGDKLSHYKQLTSLQAVLFVSHRTRSITCVERSPTGWTERAARAGESLTLTSPAVTLLVDEVYGRIELDAV